MEKAKRARKAETPKQPSLGLRLRAPYLYPDPRGAGGTHAPRSFSAAHLRDKLARPSDRCHTLEEEHA